MVNLLPESSSAPPAARRRYNRRSVVYSLLFAVLLVAAVLLHETSADGIALAAFAGALVGLALTLYEFVRLMMSLDELQSRIHTAALAIGMGAAATLATVIGVGAALLSLSDPELVGALAAFALPVGVLGYYLALHLILRRFR